MVYIIFNKQIKIEVVSDLIKEIRYLVKILIFYERFEGKREKMLDSFC